MQRKLTPRRATWVAGIVIAVLGIVLTAGLLTRAVAAENYANRLALGRNVVKLAIVVMANQTPITASDAQSVLPALDAIQAENRITEESAAALDARLLNALSPALRQAVQVVRLPEPDPEVKARALRFAERHRLDNPAKYGPSSRAFDRLVEFFQQAAER